MPGTFSSSPLLHLYSISHRHLRVSREIAPLCVERAVSDNHITPITIRLVLTIMRHLVVQQLSQIIICGKVQALKITYLRIPPPYKHSTSGPLVGCQGLATTGWQANPHPLGGSGSVCKVGHRWAAGGRQPLSLPFCPLAHLCAYWCSASLVLGANSQPQAATLPTSAA